jgi:hypothetical protein
MYFYAYNYLFSPRQIAKRLDKLENGNDISKSPSQPHKINLIPETPSKTPKKKQKKV